ncbi:hypothetical protein C2S53_016951 [Perilla frutescens var. hirtella]|uniref:Uncharacterized protein n=1 Tax=Perilla frutescens var. hirtella TaxID=608512 RepID=A0AAD4IZB9_PERFH|nr:hypothetical protein C2S53_016951 [Perilla frutescens var. hirtella]
MDMEVVKREIEKQTRELMERLPVDRSEPLITKILWRNLYQIVILLTLQFRVFNEFNARKLEKRNMFDGIHRNELFMGIIG